MEVLNVPMKGQIAQYLICRRHHCLPLESISLGVHCISLQLPRHIKYDLVIVFDVMYMYDIKYKLDSLTDNA